MVYLTDIEFNRLNLIERYNAVSEKGHYIAKRHEGGMEVYLYKLDDFYAEVWKEERLHEIARIEAVHENIISRYAEHVDLNRLMGH